MIVSTAPKPKPRFASPGLLLAVLSMGVAMASCSKPPAPAPGPDFHPQSYFVGRMHSNGLLKPIVGKTHAINVDSAGSQAAGGAVRLDQAIHWAGGGVDHRFWIMRPIPQGGYDVSLTDAVGPVAFETHGPRAHLRYRDRHSPVPLMVEQWMDLEPDGRTLDNHGVLTLLGVPVAQLEETIVHDPA